jgi:hypothetical protein
MKPKHTMIFLLVHKVDDASNHTSWWSKDVAKSRCIHLRLTLLCTIVRSKKWMFFFEIKFHSNEDIEWHCMPLELNSNKLNGIWIELNWSAIQKSKIAKT